MRRTLLLLILAGCSRGTSPAPPPAASATSAAPASTSVSASVSASASAPAPASASVAPSPGPCGPIELATLRMIDALGKKHPGTEPLPRAGIETFVAFCAHTPKGTWHVDVPPGPFQDRHALAYALSAKYVVLFETPAGQTLRFVPKERLADYGVRAVSPPMLFDYDGDGLPELVLRAQEEGEEGHRAVQLDLLTVRASAIVPYPPATSLAYSAVKDVDGDGRPDLLMESVYTESLEACGSGFPYGYPEPRFVAHSKADGTFAQDDAVAKSFARVWCAAAPKSIESSYDAVCARLWATTPKDVAAVRAKIAASCVDWICANDMAGKPQPKDAVQDCARRRKWGAKTPPFTLP